MHVPFDPVSVNWAELLNHNDEIVQFGGGGIFRGMPYQRGMGVGSVFKSLWRFLLPIGKELGSALGKQGLESSQRILSNVLEGKNVKDVLANEGRSATKSLLNRTAATLSTAIDKTAQKGGRLTHYKKKRAPSIKRQLGLYNHNTQPPKNHLRSTVPPPALKKRRKRRADAFGTY